MTLNDFNQNPESHGESDSLSATGMFLRAFDSSAPKPPEDPAVMPSNIPKPPPAATSQATGPGEFTRIFQGLEGGPGSPTPPPQGGQMLSNPFASQSAQLHSAQPSAPSLNSQAPSVSSPGEFTRISVTPMPIPPASVVRASVETRPDPRPDSKPDSTPDSMSAQPVAGAPPKLRGFSSPGVSGSASADSSFTQFFKAPPVKPATPSQPPPASANTPARPVQLEPYPLPGAQQPLPTRQPAQSSEGLGGFAFGSELKSDPISPPPTDLNPSSATGATGMMMNSFGSKSPSVYASETPNFPSPVKPLAEARQPVLQSYQTEPIPNYRPTMPSHANAAPAFPASEPSISESGSVTQLIQRLSQTPRETAQPAPPVVAPLATSGPGEFTRMISGIGTKTEPASAAPTPAPASPAFSAPAMLPVAMPAAPKAPAFAAPHAPAVKFEMPAMAAPKLSPPAIAAPQAKLPAIVPILLVVNTFLLIVLLVVVIFAMRK